MKNRTSILGFISLLCFLMLACDKDEPTITEIPGGKIWVIDQPSFSVLIFKTGGELAKTITGFTKPIDIDIDEDTGEAWIIDYYGDQLKKFDESGNLLFETPGTGGGETPIFRQPTSVCVDQDTSEVWVSDYQHNRVVCFTPGGVLRSEISGFFFPRDINIYGNRGKIWISEEGDGKIFRFSTDFAGDKTIADAELSVEGFSKPREILSEINDGCWVLDIGTKEVIRVTPNGTIAARVKGFENPEAIALASDGESIYVSDSGLDLIIGLDRKISGETTIADSGTVVLSGCFDPHGITVDALANDIYICLMGEDRTVRYDLDTESELTVYTPIEGPLVSDFYRVPGE